MTELEQSYLQDNPQIKVFHSTELKCNYIFSGHTLICFKDFRDTEVLSITNYEHDGTYGISTIILYKNTGKILEKCSNFKANGIRILNPCIPQSWEIPKRYLPFCAQTIQLYKNV